MSVIFLKFYYFILLLFLIIIFKSHTVTCDPTFNDDILICKKELCFSKGAVCETNKCICNTCFISTNNKDNLICNYAQYSGMIGFFLELFFPFGFGHLYLGNTFSALFKIGIFFLCFVGIKYVLFYNLIQNFTNNSINQNDIKNNFLLDLNTRQNDILKIRKIEYYFQLFFLVYHIYQLLCFIFSIYQDSNNQSIC